ncbi:MAG TPA: hypothetical protein VK901_22145 [Nitrospiraceae bacterium]|nr:hypothetical protein [Nitrospiraceae bacterium]
MARFYGVEEKRLTGKRTWLRDERAVALELIYRNSRIGQVEIGGGDWRIGLHGGKSGAQAATGKAGARCYAALWRRSTRS